MYQPLDGPSKQYTLSVGVGAVVEIKQGAEALSERKVVSLQSEDGKFRVFFGDGASTPSVGTVGADGILQHKIQFRSYEATKQQQLFLLSEVGTIDIHVVERA